MRGFARVGGTRDALEGLNGPHFRIWSLISISEGQVCAKWGAGADRGPYGSGKEVIREAQNRGRGYRGIAGQHVLVQVRLGPLCLALELDLNQSPLRRERTTESCQHGAGRAETNQVRRARMNK